jgi:two-component system, LuxR family, sensor kinase FixL
MHRPSTAEMSNLLGTILDSSADAINGRDLAGTVLTWNRGAERMYGYSAAEMIGQSILAIVPEDRRAELAELVGRVEREGRVESVDTIRVAKSGALVEVALTLAPLHGAPGQVIGVVATARDVGAQRRAERALRSSEARWRAIVETAVDGIIVIDADGRIESFNAAAERLFGYTERELIGQNVHVIMPEPYKGEHDAYIARYAATRERRVIGIGREVMGLRKDGSRFPLHLSVAELAIDGRTKYTGIVRDLSERVRLESRLREEAGLVRIGELAAVLAHEVKNPLAAMSGAVQILGERLPSPEDQEIVREILTRVDSLNSLMGDLLLYARPPKPAVMAIDAAELLESLIAFLRRDPQWQDVVVQLESRAEPVRADPELLRIAVQNLLVNAVQAMGGRGRLRVHIHASRGFGHIDVEDSGPGIPPTAIDKLFTPFFTTKARGTGLGLATVRRIADAHGGQVSIVRTDAHGTIVRLSIPLHHR